MTMSKEDEAREALLAKIAQLAPNQNGAVGTLRLAEAYAYVVAPNQPHGSVQSN